MSKETFRNRVNVEIRRINVITGEILDIDRLHNLITDVGLARLSRLSGGVDAVAAFGYIAIGTGTNAATVGDTSLQTEVKRDVAAASYEATAKCLFEKTFEFTSGESYSITEACVSDSASSEGQTILNRFVFTAKEVDFEIALYVKVTITSARA